MNIPILSLKAQRNTPYRIRLKSNYDQFMSIANQLHLSAKIYNLHKYNHGGRAYLYFREEVPKRMHTWAIKHDINNFELLRESEFDLLRFVNREFVRDSADMYSQNRNSYQGAPDSNVFRSTVNIGYTVDNDGNVVGKRKKLSELLAHDAGCLDVWQPIQVSVSKKNYRYGNEVQPWIKSMHARHYDRSNEGFAVGDAARSSPATHVRGYDMSEIYAILDGSKRS